MSEFHAGFSSVPALIASHRKHATEMRKAAAETSDELTRETFIEDAEESERAADELAASNA
jgi:hypothetical protein